MLRHALAGLVLAALASGCAPTCEQTCRKLTRCDVSPRLSLQECEVSCFEAEALYEIWEDEPKQDAFADHRWCVQRATCEEINEGLCYDEALYPYELGTSDVSE